MHPQTPDRWFVLTISCDSALELERCAEIMLELGATAVEEIDNRLITHLDPPEDVEDALESIRDALQRGSTTAEVSLDYSWQRHEDWSHLWRRGLVAKQISDSLVVQPSWCASPPEHKNVVTVVIDPGMAFGTAEHPTTRGSLRLLEKAISPGESIIDIGCGSGILTITAIKLGASNVISVDNDPYAVEATSANLLMNEIREKADVQLGEVSPAWLKDSSEYGGIIANIQSDVLLALMIGFRSAIRNHGWLILSGIMDSEWPSILSSARDCKFTSIATDTELGWTSAWFKLDK